MAVASTMPPSPDWRSENFVLDVLGPRGYSRLDSKTVDEMYHGVPRRRFGRRTALAVPTAQNPPSRSELPG